MAESGCLISGSYNYLGSSTPALGEQEVQQVVNKQIAENEDFVNLKTDVDHNKQVLVTEGLNRLPNDIISTPEDANKPTLCSLKDDLIPKMLPTDDHKEVVEFLDDFEELREITLDDGHGHNKGKLITGKTNYNLTVTDKMSSVFGAFDGEIKSAKVEAGASVITVKFRQSDVP